MALPALTYERYQAIGGRASQEDFDASCAAAHAAVREVVGFNEPQDDDDVIACERAIRAAIDVDIEYGSSGGIGESMSHVTLGKFSATMAGDGMSAYDSDMRRAITRELTGTTLLYQGLL